MRPGQNELWERYEDAMFTLLMDEVAHQEGQEQLEWKKQLNNDPSAALPEEVRKKGEQTIRKAFAAQSRRSARHVGFRLFQRIAVAVLVVVLTTVCAFAAFPEIRTGILNMIADVYEDHTDFSFTTNASKSDPASAYNVELAWIPDGFEVSEEGSHYSTAWKTYENGNGAILYIAESSVDNRTMTVDYRRCRGLTRLLFRAMKGQWSKKVLMSGRALSLLCLKRTWMYTSIQSL